MNEHLVQLNFRDDQSRAAVLNEAPALSSEKFGWGSLYFEHRREQTLQTVEHVIHEHYLMVKLNPISKAERMLDGDIQREFQRKGSTAYIPSGCPHRVRYDGALGSLHLMTLQPSLVTSVAEELNIRQNNIAPRFANEEDSFILATSELIYAELQQGNPHGPMFAEIFARTLAAHILTRFSKARSTKEMPIGITALKVKRLDEYIEANLTHPITLSDLATQIGLSEYHFCRAFKRTTGISPYQYLLKKRIQYACECLSQKDISIQDIAFSSGFGDPVQFSKHFKRVMGVTPTFYREQSRNNRQRSLSTQRLCRAI
jgi:AraC family transcriptional regulator